MKNTALMAVAILILATLASAAIPEIHSVVATPLYANVFNTLTCRYTASDADSDTLTTEYEWYDGADSVWYSDQTATYTTLANGKTYRCRVQVNDSQDVSGWTTSQNITTAASCINPYPFYHLLTNNTNITSLPDYNYTLLGGNPYIDLANEYLYLPEHSFLFLGGGYDENGEKISTQDTWITCWKNGNILNTLTTTGDFTTNGQETDEDFSTYYQRDISTSTSTTQTGTYTLPSIIYNQTVIEYKVAMSGTIALNKIIYIDGQRNDTSAWINLATELTTSTSWVTRTGNITTQYDLKSMRWRLSAQGSGSAQDYNYRLYELQLSEWGNTTVLNNLEHESLTVNDFTQTEGSLYEFTYLDEETEDPFDFNTSNELNSSELRIYCQSTVTEINLSDTVTGANYTLGLKGNPRKIETLIRYDDGTDYYRRFTFTESYKAFNWYLVDATVDSLMFLVFTLNDQSTTRKWLNGNIRLKRYVDTTLEEITADQWQADYTAPFYLIPNREYSITLQDEDGSEKNIGWITTVVGQDTKTLTISSTEYNFTHLLTLFDNVTFSLDHLSNGSICFTYNDSDSETDWVNWSVYNRTDGTQVYSDHTTSQNYESCYASEVNQTYYVNILFSHPDGSIVNITLGTIAEVQRKFEDLEYEGEILGMRHEAFYLIFSLFIVGAIGLMIGTRNAGMGALLMLGWIIFTSSVGWLPFYSTNLIAGSVIIITLLLLAVFENYRHSTT